jgi:hypothetical protein
LLRLGDIPFPDARKSDTFRSNKHSTMPKPVSRSVVAWLAGGVLLLLVIAGVILLPCPTSPQFMVFRIVLAFGVALLSGLLSGGLKVRYRFVAAATGGFAMYLLTLHYLPRLVHADEQCRDNFLFSIYLRDSLTQPIPGLTGRLHLQLSGDYRTVSIDANGLADFKEIPASYRNKLVTVELDAPDWQFRATRSNSMTYTLSGKSATLSLTPSDNLCCITGNITDVSGRPIPAVDIRIGAELYRTDSLGHYAITLPMAGRKREVVMRLYKSGYALKEVTQYPALQQTADFILDKIPVP